MEQCIKAHGPEKQFWVVTQGHSFIPSPFSGPLRRVPVPDRSLPVHFPSLCPSCQGFLSSAWRWRRFCVLFSRVWMFLRQTHPGTSFCPLCVILAHLYSLCVDVDVCTVKTKCARVTQVDKMVCHGYTCGCVEFDLTHQYGLTWHAILSTCTT